MNPDSHSLFSTNWKSIEFLSKIYQRYKDNKKFANEINNSTYLALRYLPLDDFVNNINKAPIVGSKIKDDKIGKFINLISILLIK